MDFNLFITNIAVELSKSEWVDIQGYSEKYELVATRDETVGIVTTRRIIAFLKGDDLSRGEIKKAVEEAHELMSKKATPPLFPTTSVIIFVFEKSDQEGDH